MGRVILQSVANPAVMEVVIVFAIVLWLIYEMTNLWVDGVVLRLRWLRDHRPVRVEPGDAP